MRLFLGLREKVEFGRRWETRHPFSEENKVLTVWERGECQGGSGNPRGKKE